MSTSLPRCHVLLFAAFLSLTAICSAQQIVHVPSDQPNLPAAISAVSDGGVIEMAAGTYTAPPGGYTIYDLPTPKSFTVRAAAGAAVVFTGGRTTDILRIAPSSLTQARPITFEFITFADGVTNDAFLGGGMTLVNAKVIFKSCTFQDNAANSPGGTGGGAQWIAGSVVSFDSCTWSNNTSPNFGGGMSVTMSRVYVRQSRFNGNRVDVPNHSTNAAGGAIFVHDATLRVSNCSFDNNRAGYVGGALYTLGSWRDPLSTPTVDVVVSDCAFTGNRAQFDTSVPHNAPALGGAIHFEGQTTAKVFNSRFTNNTARQGGAVSNYLAITEFTGCVFKGNQATGTGDEGGQGGAIIALSVENPGTNHRPIQLTVTDTLIQGSGSGVRSARQGGCIYVGGDMNFAYGLAGAPVDGTPESNRAIVVLNRVVLADAAAIGDSTAPGGLPGTGGAILGTFVNLTMNDSIVEHCETNNSGAGIQLIEGSVGNIARTTIARCTSQEQGTAFTLFGSSLYLTDSAVINNTINGTGRGVGITSAPTPAFGGVPSFDVTGLIQNCLFLNNNGQTAIYDGDRNATPFNRLQYNGNKIFPAASAFFSDVAGAKTVTELNNLVIPRSDGSSTAKSTSPNSDGTSALPVAAVLMVPPTILPAGAPGESTPIPAFIAYAANPRAILDGVAQANDAGIVPASNDGVHTLSAGSSSASTSPPRAVALNIATRLPVGTGQDVLIGGFIIQGPATKRVIIRAIGPALNGFLAGALQDPRLELHDVGGALLASNDNWRTTQGGGLITADQAIDLEGTGLAPNDPAESAVVVDLVPGAYTAVVAGANNSTGIALVEVYDLDPIQTSTLANIATRGFIQTGNNVMIGGFIYQGGAGATKVVMRGIGPSLGAVGIANPLADPTIELHDVNGATLAVNDDWRSSPDATAIQAAGFAPSNNLESAIYQATLPRGNYTVILRGKNDGTGVGVVEAYVF